MATSLFVTGASGFVGRHLLRALHGADYENVYCLTRTDLGVVGRIGSCSIRWVRADLRDTKIYAPCLGSSDIVIHLAALTGKASPQDYFSVNADATRLLIEQCKHLDVRKFLFVSSIAVKFPDKSQYYYAQSKDKAEELVRNSGLEYVILRPTLILGKESPIWDKLSRLGKKPRILVFGDGRAIIQPIFVDDLVNAILSILTGEDFCNESFDLGGPEIISMADFLQRIHIKYQGKPAPLIHLPLKPIVGTLSVIERFASSLLPFNVGQLSSFRYDGSAEPNRLSRQLYPTMKNIDAMLTALV